jgi:hypothetical protein
MPIPRLGWLFKIEMAQIVGASEVLQAIWNLSDPLV